MAHRVAHRPQLGEADDLTAPQTPLQARLGDRLRAIRRQRGLALSAVADGTAISTSFLSLLENGRSDITLGRLQRLLDFYAITYADLLPEEEPPDVRLVRAHERRHLPSPVEGIDVALLTHGSGRDMVALQADYAVGAHLHEYATGGGEAFLLLLEGELRVTLGASAPLDLAAGDALYYETSTRLEIRNTGTVPARVVAVGRRAQHLPVARRPRALGRGAQDGAGDLAVLGQLRQAVGDRRPVRDGRGEHPPDDAPAALVAGRAEVAAAGVVARDARRRRPVPPDRPRPASARRGRRGRAGAPARPPHRSSRPGRPPPRRRAPRRGRRARPRPR